MVTISVITVSLNAAKHIDRSIQSVLSQTYPAIEYLLIDGRSQDATVEIISRFKENIDYFISEPDHGIYNAMNKGIQAATGDILFFLNADDYFADESVVKDVADHFENRPETDIVFGNQLWDCDGRMDLVDQSGKVTKRRLARKTLQHQTIFAKKKLFQITNGFSENYKIVSDYEWILKVFLHHNCTYKHFDRIITIMDTSGLSWSNNFEKERRQVMRNFFSSFEIFFYRTIPLQCTAAYYFFDSKIRSSYIFFIRLTRWLQRKVNGPK